MSLSDSEDDPPLVPPRQALLGIRALVLDDNVSSAASLVHSIEHLGGVAFSATTVHEAKRLLVMNEPDVAIVDLLLLNGNGLGVIREFQEYRPSLACVLVSGLELPPGFDSELPFLPKPIGLVELVATILDAIGRMDTTPPPTERG